MQQSVRLLALVLLASWCLLPSRAPAATVQRLNTLRLDGYVGDPPPNRHERADLMLRAGQRELRFQVTEARVIKGNSTGAIILREVRRFRPNFTLRGPAELVAKVADAPLGARLRLFGTTRLGERTLSLMSVEPLPEPTARPR
ncbi:MAG: hypothetical protein SF182_12000 [Deltaproteobacteria bacterium]|nr:hypothetical protein [Deltaproteobacteria bacterium]